MYNNHGRRRLEYVIENVPIVDDLVGPRATSTAPNHRCPTKTHSGFANWLPEPGGLLSLYICEGSPCFARKRLLKTREQGLI